MTVPDEFKDNTFFMLCCGTEDGLIVNTRTYNKNLTDNGITTAYYESPGAHDNDYWRKALYFFAQCIF